MTSITLDHAGFELVVNPRFGLVEHFRKGEIDILHPAADGPPNPLTSAAYPLFPFSGRIANGSFDFEGQTIELPKNFPPEPHAIHGFSWEADWDVEDQAEHFIRMRHTYKAEHWPWSYEAMQSFALSEVGLKLNQELLNTSDRAMPGGLGWHPFFPSKTAVITADVYGYWPSENGGIPSDPEELPEAFDLRTPKTVNGLDLDHCFRAGSGDAIIDYASHKIRIVSSEVYTQYIVYNPQSEPYFCAEPVSHSPDAANSLRPTSETGWQVIGPGEKISGQIELIFEEG